MRRMTAREANRRLGWLLSTVARGEQVVITKHGRPVAIVSPYRPDLTEERKAAIERLIATMDEPVELGTPFRTFTRDEMHERD
jgi:prevent-host-death family protein